MNDLYNLWRDRPDAIILDYQELNFPANLALAAVEIFLPEFLAYDDCDTDVINITTDDNTTIGFVVVFNNECDLLAHKLKYRGDVFRAAMLQVGVNMIKKQLGEAFGE